MNTKWIISNGVISDVGNRDQNINKYTWARPKSLSFTHL